MKVENCIVDVRRRTVGSCIDLGCVFLRRFAAPIAQLTLVFAIPSLILSWLVLLRWDFAFAETMMIWSVFSGLFGGALVSGIGPQVFGQPFSAGRSLAGLASRLPLFLIWILGIRLIQYLVSFCLIVPAILTIPLLGFLAEVVYLERAPFGKVGNRLMTLAAAGNYFLVLGRLMVLLAFLLILAGGLFSGISFLSTFLFNIPGPLARIDLDGDDVFALAGAFLSEPVTAILIQACLWLATPLARLAWFFFYLDGRIRTECWDLDVAFQVEANRLEAAV